MKNAGIILGIILIIGIVGGGAYVVLNMKKGPAEPTYTETPSVTGEEPAGNVIQAIQPTQGASKQPLTMTVTSPPSGATVTNAKLTVKGRTVAGAEVFVNDAEAVADANGNFSVTITLDEGENYVLVAANDAEGNFVEKELSVTYSVSE